MLWLLGLAALTLIPPPGSAAELDLTAAERAFIARHPDVVLGTDESWMPYVVKQADGRLTGHDVELIARINALTGLRLRLKVGVWRDLIEQARRREIDGLSAGGIHPEREVFLNFSDIYFSINKMLLVRSDNPGRILTPEDLAGKTIAIHRGNLVDEKIARRFTDSTILPTETVEAMLAAVVSGEADATFGNGATLFVADRIGLPYLRIAFPLPDKLELAFGIRKDWPELVSILNKALAAIPAVERTQLRNKWFVGSEVASSEGVVRTLALSTEERTYLNAKQELRFCIDPQWMPIEGVDAQGQYQGIASDYLQLVAEKLAIPLRRHPTRDWRETLEAAQNGQCDLLPAAMRTEARAAYLDFTRPYLELPLVVATGREPLYIDNLKQLGTAPVGVLADSAIGDILQRAYPDARLTRVADLGQGLRQVADNRLIAMVDLLPTIGYEILNRKMLGVTITGTLEQRMALAMAVRKGDTRLLAMVQRALDSIPEGQRVLLANRWLRVRSEQTRDYGPLVEVGLAAIALILMLGVWQRRRIRRSERARARAEREAQARREYLAHVSHEVRTPINAILGLSQLLAQSELNPQQRRWSDRLQVTVDHLLDTFNAVLEYSFTDSHVIQLDRQAFRLGDVIDRIEAQFAHKASERGLALHIHCRIDRECRLEGDLVRLLQVIGNLLDNALKFTDEGQVSLTLEQPAGPTGPLGLIVEDTGIGIPADQQEAIFQPFTRIRSTDQAVRAGHGLGLAITRQLVQAMGGTLSLQSEPGGGSRFECRLPLIASIGDETLGAE